MTNSWDEDDAVGYGKPPRWTRFEKGKSGNPKGRPKRQHIDKRSQMLVNSDHDLALRRALDRDVCVNENGRRVRRKAIEVVAQAQAQAAMKGNVHAQRHVLQQALELEQRESAREVQQAAMQEAAYKQAIRWRELQAKKWSRFAPGQPEPDEPWPHPDDLILDPDDYQVHVRGPCDEASVPLYARLQAYRNFFFCRFVLIPVLEGKKSCRSGLNVVVCLDQALPRRWQIIGQDPDARARFDAFSLMSWRGAVKLAKDSAAEIERLDRLIGPERRTTEVYKLINRMMQPLLKPMGYSSLRQFELAYAASDGKPPWPRTPRSGHSTPAGALRPSRRRAD